MYLSELLITRGGAEIRKVKFKRGLNLILDKPVKALVKSGNNIGKTTVLRLIDFCLGSDGSDIWQDPEFKTVNQEIYDYLHGTVPVKVTLKIEGKSDHVFERAFSNKSRPKDIFYVDGVLKKNLAEYRSAVRAVLFGSDGSKPSLRQLMPKFIRSSQNSVSKTLKVLGDYASEVDYEALHLFIFGFFAVDVLEERPRLMLEKKKLERDLQALIRIRNEGEIEQLLIHLRREIDEISLSNELKGEVPEIAAHANEVTAIRSQAANAAAELGRFESEISTILTTIDELEDDYASVDQRAIRNIYLEAQRYIPELQHDWEELAEFVHELRARKGRFLSIQIDELQERAQLVRNELFKLQNLEEIQIGELVQSPSFARALELRTDLQEKLKRLGSLEQALEDIRGLKSTITNIEHRLELTQEEIESGKAMLASHVAVFNKYFSGLSKHLYGEQYLLHFEESGKGTLKFQLTSVGSNVGSGKKMSQTAAFDLAYIEFLNETGIQFPRFVCHDGLEAIHGNQLSSLLRTANALDGQFVLATLRDKLPIMPGKFIEENTILELSQDDKLFKV